MKYFVEIGSNNYETLLPLCKDGWTGLMVDPLPGIFDQLEGRYNCRFENLAIAETPDEMDFFVVDQNNDWSSLKNDHATNIDGDAKVRIIKVRAITFDELMSLVNFDQIDILKIDTEGYDFKIIKSIDFSKYKINLIQFEHHHMTDEEYNTVRHILLEHGFEFSRRDDLNTVFTRQ